MIKHAASPPPLKNKTHQGNPQAQTPTNTYLELTNERKIFLVEMQEEGKLPQTRAQATIALIAPYRQPCHLLLSLTICEPISFTKSKPSPLQQIYQLG